MLKISRYNRKLIIILFCVLYREFTIIRIEIILLNNYVTVISLNTILKVVRLNGMNIESESKKIRRKQPYPCFRNNIHWIIPRKKLVTYLFAYTKVWLSVKLNSKNYYHYYYYYLQLYINLERKQVFRKKKFLITKLYTWHLSLER